MYYLHKVPLICLTGNNLAHLLNNSDYQENLEIQMWRSFATSSWSREREYFSNCLEEYKLLMCLPMYVCICICKGVCVYVCVCV